jgi:ABC-type branched-subunit amino acid transport system substrate-binding protein
MTDPRAKPVAIAAVAVLVTSVLSVGQVKYDLRQQSAKETLASTDASSPPLPGTPGASAAPAAGVASTAPVAPGAPGAGRPGAGKPGTSPGQAPGTVTAGPDGSVPTRVKPGQVVKVPDYGLRTQGVTAKSVKIGIDYNKSGCGDASSLEAALGPAVVGDPEKAVRAFTRHVNDTGGVRGRTLSTVTVDDGGPQCPERNTAAAVEMVDQHKVFLAAVGLHEVGDAVIKRKIPIYGGRSTKAEQAARGIGQFRMVQDADADFENWASFGKHYLGTGASNRRACFVHPDTNDFNNQEKILVAKMRAQGLAFADIIRYSDDASTGQQQATSAVIRMKGKCEQVWFLANNAIALVFFTNAAEQQDWHPTYTFTGRTLFADQALGGSLMQPDQWENAIGLSPRIKPGDHPNEGNCRKIYEKYYPGDGQSGSASVTVACEAILTSTEAMERALDLTGELTANSLQVGINAIRRDFYWDGHVPVTYTIPTSLKNAFDFTGYDHQTVVKWNRGAGDYAFPEYPRYWTRFGAGRSGGEDLRPMFDDSWKKP